MKRFKHEKPAVTAQNRARRTAFHLSQVLSKRTLRRLKEETQRQQTLLQRGRSYGTQTH